MYGGHNCGLTVKNRITKTTFKVETKKVVCGKKKKLVFCSFTIIQILANSNVIFLENILLLTKSTLLAEMKENKTL